MTCDEIGQVDICVVGPGGGWHPEPIDHLDAAGALEDVHREVAPLFHLLPRVLPDMYQRRWGRIIAIALHPTIPSPAYAYNVGKAARTHAVLLAQDQAWRHGVTVNVVAPGPVPAIDSLDDAIDQCDHSPAWHDRTTTAPQDVAESVAFLCSEAGRFITGCVLPFRFSEQTS
jgi:3-hydroxybutyrate dehydrogenase